MFEPVYERTTPAKAEAADPGFQDRKKAEAQAEAERLAAEKAAADAAAGK